MNYSICKEQPALTVLHDLVRKKSFTNTGTAIDFNSPDIWLRDHFDDIANLFEQLSVVAEGQV